MYLLLMSQICVLGVFVADLCFFGESIPDQGQTILGHKHQVGPGGKGSNQAITIAKLNGKVSFITKIGRDAYGEMALKLYKETGVNTKSVIEDFKQATGVAGIMIDQKGNNAINIVPGAAATLNKEDVNLNLKTIEKSKFFITQFETPDDVTWYAIKKAKDNNCKIILNPAPARKIDEKNFKLIDYFTPNETEAEFYLDKKIISNNDIVNAGTQFLNLGVKNVIITLGEKGVYFTNKSESIFIEAYKLKSKTIDTTGAGDVFNGAFTYALSKDYPIKEAIIFANKVAAISTTRLGAANSAPSFKEVESY